MPERYELVEIFKDTLNFLDQNEILREAVKKSTEGTKFYPSDFAKEVNLKKKGNICVIEGRTLQTAIKLSNKFPEQKITVLNFASSTKPGGGVWHGSRAQEESICRSSSLYPAINTEAMKEAYYSPHNENYNFRGWDDCIYTPDVIICRDDSDEIPKRLTPDKFVKIDVVTCAAPHIRDDIIKAEELFNIHVKRAKHILRVSAFNDTDIFIGGAFGCGAFHNDPYIVAWAWREAMKEYGEKFNMTAFAIYSRGDNELNSLRAFRNEFAG